MACLLVTYAGDAFISPNFEVKLEIENVSSVEYNVGNLYRYKSALQ